MQKAIHGITVAHFFEIYKDKLKLELITGADGLHRLIREGSINRPSLALTGFCVLTAALTATISDRVPVNQRGFVSGWSARTVVSRVANSLSSTSTSLLVRALMREDFPAFV